MSLFTSGMVCSSQYWYTKDLLTLDSCRSTSDNPPPYHNTEVLCPVAQERWHQELSSHPDKAYMDYILQGWKHGFRIGFNPKQRLTSATSNMCIHDPAIVSDYLSREVGLGRTWTCPQRILPRGIHISPLGIIPKKNKPGKWRMIVDLSAPKGCSVNDGISPELSSLSYPSIDHLASLITSKGKGAWLVKADIKEAYRMIPVHPEDQHLLGLAWQGTAYIDKRLPFGLRSAPKVFSAVADALQFILCNKGVTHSLHYLDDYILVTDSLEEAESQKQCLVSTFNDLQVPLELSKLEGPATCLQFLGIEVDTSSLQLRLPKEKLAKLQAELAKCVHRRSVTKKELQSLTGLLQFATKVIRPGRPFLHRLYAMQNIGSHPGHFIRLNQPARADLLWWHLFASKWNGISLLWDLGKKDPDISLVSDASGSWGCGAFWSPHWFQLQWDDRLQPLSIAVKELIPIVIAAAVFGRQWKGKIILFQVDNLGVVQVINATYCREVHLMHLIRVLVFLAAHFDFWFKAEHIEGSANTQADALSRNKMSSFFLQAPTALSEGTHIPAALVSLMAQALT